MNTKSPRNSKTKPTTYVQKLFLFVFISILCFSVVFAGINDASGAIAYYSFDNDLTDITPSTWDLTAYNGAAISGVQSKLGNGSLFIDGTNDYANSGTSFYQFNSSSLTFCAWVYRTDTSAGNIIKHLDGASFDVDLLLTGTNTFQPSVYDGTTQIYDASPATAGSLNNWHHYCITYDGSVFVVYMNAVSSYTSSATPIILNSTDKISIGQAGSNYLQGYIDEIAIYDEAKSATGISAIFNLTENPFMGLLDPSLTINKSTANSIEYGTSVTVYGNSCPSELDCYLYKINSSETVLVSNPYTAVLPIDNYTFIFNTSGNVNYSSDSVSTTLIVQDTNAPYISSVSLQSDGIYENVNQIVFTVDELSNCSLSLNGTLSTLVNFSNIDGINAYSFNDFLPTGTYSLNISCSDNELNIGSYIATNIGITKSVYDMFDGFFDLGEKQQSCPLDEGETDRLYYIVVLLIAVVLFIVSFYIDNGAIGMIACVILLYIALITGACNTLLSVLLGLLAVVGGYLCASQLSLTKT